MLTYVLATLRELNTIMCTNSRMLYTEGLESQATEMKT